MATDRIRINKEITAPELRVISADGGNLGILSLSAALEAGASAFVAKPFTPEEFLAAIRAAIAHRKAT